MKKQTEKVMAQEASRRILWIGKRPTSGETGDEVFDRKTIAACRDLGGDVDIFHPEPVGRVQEVLKLASGALPYPRSRFATRSNLNAIMERSRAYDSVICSWESFDALVRRLVPPSILIVHNIVSQAFVPEYAPNPLAYPAALRAGLWERRWYRADHFAAIGALSKRDLSYLESFRQKPKLLLLPPGMPLCLGLDPEAMLRKELVIQGTFDWFPKRRDVIRFARDYMAMNQRLPILADSLPPEATRLLQPSGIPSTTDMHRFIRFGVITDKFVAGHKLKTMAYIASNMIVLSLADVSFDFSHIPDHDFFIRKINSVAEIPYHVDAVADLPVASLRMRFSRFQEACARDFSWHRVAASLLDACASLTSGNCSDQIGSASTRT